MKTKMYTNPKFNQPNYGLTEIEKAELKESTRILKSFLIAIATGIVMFFIMVLIAS